MYYSWGEAVVDTPEDFPLSSLIIVAISAEAGTHGAAESIIVQIPYMEVGYLLLTLQPTPILLRFLAHFGAELPTSTNTILV